jgi:site-specific DNA-methyltransferase (adenine-specific)
MKSQIIIGDCRSIATKFEDDSIQTIITSPPYFNMRNYGNDEQIGLEETAKEYILELCGVFDLFKPKLKKGGSLFVNLNDKYVNKSLQMIPYLFAKMMTKRGWILRNQIMWVKPNYQPSPVKDRMVNAHEPIFHFVKSQSYYYDIDCLRTPTVDRKDNADAVYERFKNRIADSILSPEQKANAYEKLDKLHSESRLDGGARIRLNDGKTKASFGGDTKLSGRAKELQTNGFYFLTNNPKGKTPPDILSVNVKSLRGSHEAPFPELLIEPLIMASSKEGDIILDPFVGSGTLLLVADRYNRVGVGIELNEALIRPELKDLII